MAEEVKRNSSGYPIKKRKKSLAERWAEETKQIEKEIDQEEADERRANTSGKRQDGAN